MSYMTPPYRLNYETTKGLRDYRCSAMTVVSDWDLQNDGRDGDRMVQHIKRKHRDQIALLIEDKMTISLTDTPHKHEREFRTECFVIPIGDLYDLISREVEYRMSRMRPIEVGQMTMADLPD